MKKVLLLSLITICILFCASCRNNSEDNNMINYESGIYYNKNWNETVGTYDKTAVIPDKETAINVAKAIFDGMKKSETAQKYEPQSVFYDNEDEVWIISFWNENEQNIAGGDCNIAISKNDGRILRIWFGE